MIRSGAALQLPYTSALTPSYGEVATHAVVGDVDSDNDLDIIYLTPSSLQVMRNNGSGTFGSALTLSYASGTAVAAANGVIAVSDGTDIDVVRVSGASLVLSSTVPAGSVSKLTASESYVFADSTGYDVATWTPRTYPACVAAPIVMDFDGDGATDVVCASEDGVIAYPNGGGVAPVLIAAGSFGELATGDIDGNGRIDIVAVGSGRSSVTPILSRRAETPSFDALVGQALRTGSFTRVAGITTYDADGDGKDDIVAGTNEGLAYWFVRPAYAPSVGDARSVALRGSPTGVAAADVNRDGVLDLVVAIGDSSVPDEKGGLEVVLADKAGAAPTSRIADDTISRSSEGLLGLALGDVDADGLIDAVTPSAGTNRVHVFFGAGDGFVADAATIDLPGNNPVNQPWTEKPVAVCSFGIVAASRLYNESAGQTFYSLYRITSAGRVLSAAQIGSPVLMMIESVVCADFDSDGFDDLIMVGNTNLGVLYRGGAGGSLTPSGSALPPGSSVVLADWNKDGAVDFAYPSRGLTPGKFWGAIAGTTAAGVGNSTFSIIQNPSTCSTARAALMDVDGDGSFDALEWCTDPPSLGLRFAADVTATTYPRVPPLAADAEILAMSSADLDGDGVDDLIEAQASSQSLLIRSGRRNTTPWTYPATSAATQRIRLTAAVTLPPDRFGGTTQPPLALRSTTKDAAFEIRASGRVAAGHWLAPLTSAWEISGARRFAIPVAATLPFLTSKSSITPRVFFRSANGLTELSAGTDFTVDTTKRTVDVRVTGDGVVQAFNAGL